MDEKKKHRWWDATTLYADLEERKEPITFIGGSRDGGKIYYLENAVRFLQQSLKDQREETERWKSAALYYAEQRKNQYNAHEVAEILAEAFGDPCACNFNSNDAWLPEKCELQDACPRPDGVACWEQYLKFRGAKMDGDGNGTT
jgi:hypothetical protein